MKLVRVRLNLDEVVYIEHAERSDIVTMLDETIKECMEVLRIENLSQLPPAWEPDFIPHSKEGIELSCEEILSPNKEDGPTRVSHEVYKRILDNIPQKIKDSMMAEGWNPLGVYDVVKTELSKEE